MIGGNVASCVSKSSLQAANARNNEVASSTCLQVRLAPVRCSTSHCKPAATPESARPSPLAPSASSAKRRVRGKRRCRLRPGFVGNRVDGNQLLDPSFAGRNRTAGVMIAQCLERDPLPRQPLEFHFAGRRLRHRFSEKKTRPFERPASQRHEARSLTARPPAVHGPNREIRIRAAGVHSGGESTNSSRIPRVIPISHRGRSAHTTDRGQVAFVNRQIRLVQRGREQPFGLSGLTQRVVDLPQECEPPTCGIVATVCAAFPGSRGGRWPFRAAHVFAAEFQRKVRQYAHIEIERPARDSRPTSFGTSAHGGFLGQLARSAPLAPGRGTLAIESSG